MTTMDRETPDLRAGLDLYFVVGTSKPGEDAGHHQCGGKVPLVHCFNSCILFCSSPGISRQQETRASLLNTVYTL